MLFIVFMFFTIGTIFAFAGQADWAMFWAGASIFTFNIGALIKSIEEKKSEKAE